LQSECPVCSSIESSMAGKCGEYELYHCGNCDLVYADPMKADMSVYDEGDFYRVRDMLLLDPLTWDYRWEALEFLKNPPLKGGKLLDIGCGTGYFVKHARDMGFDSYGLDLSEGSIKSGREYFGLETIHAMDLTAFIQQNQGMKFDVVTLFHVLEHLEKPNLIMDGIKGILSDEAVVSIALPLRGRWPDLAGDTDSPPHHLSRWSPEALENFLNLNGFRVRKLCVEGFSPRNMYSLLYPYVLKLIPSVTLNADGRDGDAGKKSHEDVIGLLKRRKMKIALANTAGFPFWVFLRLLGARGPNFYVEAVLQR